MTTFALAVLLVMACCLFAFHAMLWLANYLHSHAPLRDEDSELGLYERRERL